MSKNSENKVEIRLPRREGTGKNQTEFFSVNGKNYIIERGKTVMVPAFVAEVIFNGELAEEAALAYAETKLLKEAK